MKELITFAAIVALMLSMIAGVWWLFYFLWNSIAAEVFGAPELTFWQSVGLLMLVGMITGGIRTSISKK